MRLTPLVPVFVVTSISLLQGCASLSSGSPQIRPEVHAAKPAAAPFAAVSKSLGIAKPALKREIVGVRVVQSENEADVAQSVAADNTPKTTVMEKEIAENAPAPAGAGASASFGAQSKVSAASPEYPRELVKEIQANLSRHGFDVGTTDGMFGPRTQRAIRAYQEFHSVPQTGEPSENLLDLLRSE